MLRPSKELLEAMQAAERAVAQNAQTDQIFGVREGAPPLAAWPAEPCSIIFLDFDGVLNSENSFKESGTRYKFSSTSTEALNFLLLQSDAKLVISSSWREHWTLKENAEFLEREGVVSGRVIGKTPILNVERGAEIDHWLQHAPFAIKSFVIIDDREDMQMHVERLVRVNSAIGITMDLSRRAIEILNQPWALRKA